MRPTIGIVADGACAGNPGPIQWRGVDIESGEELFQTRSYSGGTNNIAEFLAIVHALAITQDSNLPVYSDSMVGRSWVRKGYCTLDSCRSPELAEVITRANVWLKENAHQVSRVQVWETKSWGENIADFGRKR